eukprot:CAMPEP_0176438502 /NCGR_PEP_ID=MMETSP0127-20121128/19324_1 /TAXON_ID=938130 /ORGANISM="Platyophrya macrostoma, Strain WH" /LENGTH=1497 /DNA_ID=CAMNT_0017822469 /DNA_START=43 /DNA_END=4532 /DNA_ORIENTATION=+
MTSIDDYELPTYEGYLLAENKDEFISTLIPGTDSHFYFSLLKALQKGDGTLSDQDIKNLESYAKLSTVRSKSIQLRNLLNKLSKPGESKEKKEALEELRKHYFGGYQFNHTQPSNISSSTLNKTATKIPSELDQKLIQVDLTNAYTNRTAMDELNNTILTKLDVSKLATSPPEVIEQYLQRAELPTTAGIPQLLFALYEARRRTSKTYIVPAIYIGKLNLEQLNELGELIPDLKLNRDYVGEKFIREFKLDGKSTEFTDMTPQEREARRETLLKMYSWTKNLPSVFANFNQQVLFELLMNGLEAGIFNMDHFLEYLKNPGRDYGFKSKEHTEHLRTSKINQDNFWESIHMFAIARYKRPDELIKIYLEHFFKSAKDLKPFDEYLDQTYLEKIFYEVKLYQGESVSDINRVFTLPEIKNLTESKEITILEQNRTYFSHGEDVSLQVRIKNVSSVVVKVFEFNVENYYKKHNKQVDGTMNLDGIVASEEKLLEFKESPIVKSVKQLDFENISKKKQGVFIIDLIGGGLSSRVVIKKGRLNYVQRNTLNGHQLTIIDEQFEVVKGERVHEANSDGQVLLPYATSEKSGPLILINGDFAELTQFTVRAESYSFRCAYIYNHETLLMGNKAKIIIQPRLFVNGTIPVNIGLLKDVKVTTTTVNDLGVPNVSLLENITLDHCKDIEVEFPVPAKLTQLYFEIKASIDSMNKSGGKNQEVSDRHNIGITTYANTDIFSNLYLKETDKGYEVYLLGKNGEPKANIQMNLTLTHRHTRKAINQTLLTDEEGKVKLGLLEDILSITASIKKIGDISEVSKSWSLDEKFRVNYPQQEIKLTDKDGLSFPLLHNEASVHKLSLVERVGGRTINNLFSVLKVENQILTIPPLAVGEYTLNFKDQGKLINIVVIKGDYWNDSYIRAKNELVEVRNQINNIVIRETQLLPHEKDPELCDIQIDLYADQPELTRVHVFAYQFFPQNVNSIAESLQGINASAGLQKVNNGLRKTLFMNNRRLGDEYVYVLDRKNQNRYIGNTLERPPILLKKDFVRDTSSRAEQLSSGEDFRADEQIKRALMEEERFERERAYQSQGQYPQQQQQQQQMYRSAPGGGYSNPSNFDNFLNFLKVPASVYSNLKVGADGSIHIKDFPYKNYALIQVVASNLTANVSQTFPLPSHPIQTKDQTLKSQLKKDKFYSIARGSALIQKGKSLEIKDLTSTEIQVVDSLQKLFEVEKQLRACHGSDNEEGRSFEYWKFLKNWSTLSLEEKLDEYDKNASHELNVFIYFRDQEFFKKIVHPFIQNKIQKQLVDSFLLGDEKKLLKYAQTSKIEDYSALELMLLIVGLRKNHQEQAIAIAEKIDNFVKLTKIDTQTFKQLFDTVLNSKTEEEAKKFAVTTTNDTRGASPRANAGIRNMNMNRVTQSAMPMNRNFNAMPMSMNAAPRNFQVQNECLDYDDEIECERAEVLMDRAMPKAKMMSLGVARRDFDTSNFSKPQDNFSQQMEQRKVLRS